MIYSCHRVSGRSARRSRRRRRSSRLDIVCRSDRCNCQCPCHCRRAKRDGHQPQEERPRRRDRAKRWRRSHSGEPRISFLVQSDVDAAKEYRAKMSHAKSGRVK